VFVVVAEEGGEVRATVADAGNLKQLHAEFRGVGDDRAAAALAAAGLGRVDGDHAWLDAGALRAAGDGSAAWATGFDGMLAYAASQGWVSADGAAVRAHIVRVLSSSARPPRPRRRSTGPRPGDDHLRARPTRAEASSTEAPWDHSSPPVSQRLL
jgi:hypothetical protein